MGSRNVGLKLGSDDACFDEVVTDVGNSPGGGGNDSPDAPDGLIEPQFHL